MERIGVAASKMSHGRPVLYNLFVILISFLFSLLIFFIAGSSITLALIIIGYIVNGVLPVDLTENWGEVVRVCMITLTVCVGVFNLLAILKNIRISKK